MEHSANWNNHLFFLLWLIGSVSLNSSSLLISFDLMIRAKIHFWYFTKRKLHVDRVLLIKTIDLVDEFKILLNKQIFSY